MSITWGAYDHYGYAFVALAGTLLGAWFLLWLTQRSRFSAVISTYRGVAPPFVGVVGVLFGLTLAFIANDSWNAHDRAVTTVFREADTLRAVVALAARLPEPERGRVNEATSAYIRAVVEDEWPRMARRQTSPTAGNRLDDLLVAVAAADGNGAVPALLVQQVIQVRGLRTTRLELSETHVNPLKWLGMAFLGFLTMITVAMVHVDQARAELLAVMIFAAAAGPTAAIVLVQGNPFQHPTQVSAGPLAELLP